VKCRASSTAVSAVAGCRTYSAAAQATAANSVRRARSLPGCGGDLANGGVGIQNAQIFCNVRARAFATPATRASLAGHSLLLPLTAVRPAMLRL